MKELTFCLATGPVWSPALYHIPLSFALFLALLVPQIDSLPSFGASSTENTLFSSLCWTKTQEALRHQRKSGSFTTGFGYQVPVPQCLTILVSNFTRDLLGNGRVQEGWMELAEERRRETRSEGKLGWLPAVFIEKIIHLLYLIV